MNTKKVVCVTVIATTLTMAGFNELIDKAKDAAQKCWSNPACKQSVMDGFSGLAKLFQKK